MTLKEKEEKYFFKTYQRLDIEIEKGEGCYLISKSGVRYLDLFGGLAVNALGYNNRIIKDAIKQQIENYIHVSNLFLQAPQIELAELLINNTGFEKIFFSNSGTEAMEGAIKLIRKWGKSRNKSDILSFDGSFHGRTMGSLSITGRQKYRNGYEPFLEHTNFCKYNDIVELEGSINENTLAIVIELIQGEGGINEASPNFLTKINELRQKYNFLLIADEIQSGLGRTGKLFSYEHFNMKPDIIVIAKPLGGGLPLGAFLGNKEVADVFTVGAHGTTFGGNPVACAAGYVTLKEILDNGVMENAENVGIYFRQKLNELMVKYHTLVKEVRGRGLMIGIELNTECANIVKSLLDKGVLVNCTNNNVIRLLPPLILNKEEVDFAISQFEAVFETL